MSPRLLHVIDDARPIGGAQTYLHGVAAGLAARGWDNGLVAERGLGEGDFAWRGADPGEFAPDVVLLHTVDGADTARRLAAVAPTFVYEHDYRHVSPGNLRFFHRSETFCEHGFGLRCLVKPYTERCNNRRPDRVLGSIGRVLAWKGVWPRLAGVLCATEFVAGLHAEAGVPRDKLHVVGYFADPPATTAAAERRDILYVGRTSPVKGVHHLLRAIAGLERARLVVAGGPNAAPLQELARELGIADRVEFPGWLGGHALEAAFARAVVLAMPSVWPEAFGIAGIEALARGVPVVASAVGGIPEWLADGECGLLVPPGDPVSLAAAIGRLLADRELAERMGREGAARAARLWSLDAHLARLLPVLEGAR